MITIQQMKKVFEQDNKTEKMNLLSCFQDYFDYYSREVPGYKEMMEFLISQAVSTEDQELKKELIYSIIEGECHTKMPEVDFDPIEQYLPSAPIPLLHQLIYVLGYTYNKKYIPTIRNYAEHDDFYVREAVKDSLVELGAE